MNLPRREGGVFSAARQCIGTHQFRRDALLGHSAHLGDPSLHLCFDVALLSSSEPDPGDTLRDKSSLVHPLILPIHCTSCLSGIPGVGYMDKHNKVPAVMEFANIVFQ